MTIDIQAYNSNLSTADAEICDFLAKRITVELPEATCKIWHKHPTWFIEDNPVVGYSKLKKGIKLMFWSGVSFDEKDLLPGSGKFKDAFIYVKCITSPADHDFARWLIKAREIQWDYKNIVKRKGVLFRLK